MIDSAHPIAYPLQLLNMSSRPCNPNLTFDPLKYFLDVVDTAVDARLLAGAVVEAELWFSFVDLEQLLQGIRAALTNAAVILVDEVDNAVELGDALQEAVADGENILLEKLQIIFIWEHDSE